MTLTLLVSVSLLALVVTTHPIPPESELVQGRPVEVQNALQAIFESRTGHPAPRLFTGETNVHVRVTSPEKQSAYLAQLDDIAIKAIVPLTERVVHTDGERKLHEALGSLNDVDGGMRSVAGEDDAASLGFVESTHGEIAPLDDKMSTEDQPRSDSSAHTNTSVEASSPLVVMLFSCMVALVAFLGIWLALYIIAILRSRAHASQNAWEMVPRTEKQTNNYSGCEDGLPGETPRTPSDSKPQHQEVLESLLFDANVSQSDSHHTPMDAGPNKDIYTPDLITFDDVPVVDDIHSDEEEPGDFYDAYSDPPTPNLDTVPEIILSHPAEDYSDPPVPSLTVTPQPPITPLSRSPARRPLQMRELNSSPIPRPAWSLRAEEDTSLFIPSPFASSRSLSPSTPVQPLPLSPSDDALSMAVQVPRRRGYRSAIPEFDIALAMQLRPGLGIGADPAWMIRFLMAMFGWFTVLLTGKTDRRRRLAT